MVLHSIAFGTAIGVTALVLISAVLYVMYFAVHGSRTTETREDARRRRTVLGWTSLVAVLVTGKLWWLSSLQQHEEVTLWIAITAGIIAAPFATGIVIAMLSLFSNESPQTSDVEQ